MRTFRSRAALALLALYPAACSSPSGADESAGAAPAPDAEPSVDAGCDAAYDGDLDPVDFGRAAPRSCALSCPSSKCAEKDHPYECPQLGAWSSIPHEDACGCWDGTYPAPQAGKCQASAPTGEAAKYAGPDPDHPGVHVLPDGRRSAPAGASWIFAENDLRGGLTTGIAAVPGTRWVLTVDSGYGDHAVRAIDTARIGAGDPVASYVRFGGGSTLNQGIAFVAPDRVYVATDDGVVQALSFDAQTGTLARDDGASLALPPASAGGGDGAWYAVGVAASADGKRLAVSSVNTRQLLLFDVDPASPTYQQQLGAVDLGEDETFGVWFDPADAAGARAYVSMWAGRKVVEVDTTDPASPAVLRTFATGQNPQGIAFLDGRWMVVADDFGDTLTVVDRVAGTASRVPVDTNGGLRGFEPSNLAWDGARGRLYATLAGLNAVAAWDVDLGGAAPTLTPAGRLPTAWWPAGAVVQDDGSLVVASMRGVGPGPNLAPYDIADGDVTSRLRGGIQRVPSPDAKALADGAKAVAAATDVGALAGAPKVDCAGAEDDFPLPATNDAGPSKRIDHVILLVRENKTFDGLFGDIPGVRGNPAFAFKQQEGEMDRLFPNTRGLARAFGMSDNYYTSAELSIQGHIWATYGRTSDFDERTWAMTGDGRSTSRAFTDIGGIAPVGRPDDGSISEWLVKQKVKHLFLGEGVGVPANVPLELSPLDPSYPGGPVQSLDYPDVEKGCWVASRARVRCDLPSFVYLTMPNDHTSGVSPSRALPETYIAVNDEATGILVDGISHSPFWKSTLVLVVEDDPTQGGESVDNHRSMLVAISPWVKRGYVSHTHVDVSSVHKIVAHVLGIPYPNVQVAQAGLPLDMFTSTPDYTPYDHVARRWPLACGGEAPTAEQELSASFDLDDVDRQVDLDQQVTRWLRGAPLTRLPPALAARAAERVRLREERARRAAPADAHAAAAPRIDDDDADR